MLRLSVSEMSHSGNPGLDRDSATLMPEAKSSKAAVIGVLGVLLGVAGTHVFNLMEAKESEIRKQRADAIIGYMKAQQGGSKAEIVASQFTVLTFSSSEIVKKLAASLRQGAQRSIENPSNKCSIKKSDDDGLKNLQPYIELRKAVRNEYNPKQPVSDNIILTLTCPDPCKPCLGYYYIEHLK